MEFISNLQFNNNDFIAFNGIEERLEIEDYENYEIIKLNNNGKDLAKIFEKYFDIKLNNLAIFNNEIFKYICDCQLPVIARNYITESGISGNLFYEEVLPRFSRMYFILGYDSFLLNGDKNLIQEFERFFNNPDNIYQFGANYSIGYGFSKIKRMEFNNEQKKN